MNRQIRGRIGSFTKRVRKIICSIIWTGSLPVIWKRSAWAGKNWVREQMINKEEFLKTCNLTEDDLTAARISWEELTEIYEDYMSKTKLFRHLGKEFVDEYIYDIERAGIHSYRYRTKNPMHLLEKIIRKRKENYAKFDISTNRITTNTSQI